MSEQVFVALGAGVLGAIIGSFLNVVVHRVPLGISLVRPPSTCPGCGTAIRARDNVPVVSWLLLRGRCRSCATRISVRYPLIEALTAVTFVGVVLRFFGWEERAFVAAACAVLLPLAFIDLEHRRVPNRIVLPASAAALVWVVAAGVATGDGGMVAGSLSAGAAGFVILFVIAVVSGGMGFGDVKLMLFIGLVTGRFGWPVFVLALFSGFVLGGLVAIALLVTGRRGRKDAIPFAPMLCLGGILALFAGAGPVEAWFGL